MSPSGPIVPIDRERVDDRSATTLACWERAATPRASIPIGPFRGLDTITPAQWAGLVKGASTVVVAVTTRRPSVADDVVEMAVQAGARTYLMAPSSWALGAGEQALLTKSRGRLLARLGAEPPATWVVADRRRGLLLLGEPGQPCRWAMELDANQAESLAQAFAHLFWHEALEEALPRAGSIRFQKCLPAPYPAPSTPFLQLPSGRLTRGGDASAPLLASPDTLVEPTGSGPDAPPRLLFMPPRGETFAHAERLAGQKTEIVWVSAGLPRLALTAQRGVLSVGEGVFRLALALEAAPSLAIMQSLQRAAASCEWRFHGARALRDVAGEVLIRGASTPEAARDEAVIDLGPISAPELFKMESVAPEAREAPPPLARRVRYRWRVVPLLAPRGAGKAKLLGAWSELDDYVFARVDALRARLGELDADRPSLVSRLKSLASTLLGLDRDRSRLLETLSKLREQPPSKRPAEADKMIEELAQCERDVDALQKTRRDAIEAAELRAEEERQRLAHDAMIAKEATRRDESLARVKDLRGLLEKDAATLAEVRGQLAARAEELQRSVFEARRAEAERELPTVEAELKLEQGKLAEAEQRAASARSRGKGSKADKAASQEHKEVGEGVKARERRIEAHRQALTMAFVFEPKRRHAADEAWTTLDAQVRKLEAEQREHEADRAKAQAGVDQSRRQLDTVFQFLPPAATAPAAGKKPALAAPRIPTEHPPRLGTLLEDAQGRYLEVQTWQQAEKAGEDAVRLRAKLVAKRDGSV